MGIDTDKIEGYGEIEIIRQEGHGKGYDVKMESPEGKPYLTVR